MKCSLQIKQADEVFFFCVVVVFFSIFALCQRSHCELHSSDDDIVCEVCVTERCEECK